MFVSHLCVNYFIYGPMRLNNHIRPTMLPAVSNATYFLPAFDTKHRSSPLLCDRVAHRDLRLRLRGPTRGRPPRPQRAARKPDEAFRRRGCQKMIESSHNLGYFMSLSVEEGPSNIRLFEK